MEDTIKDQQSAVVPEGNVGKSKLRYPLRSATKSKEEKSSSVSQLSNSSASKRERVASTVSKSMGVLDLSGKDKSARAKPPRRLSIPAKSVAASSATKAAGNITPISEARTKKSVTNGQGKNETPLSDVSKASSSRKKFNALALASYWSNLVKTSESMAKHSISLAFFKLALEAVSEPVQIQRLRIDLKSYVNRHELGDFGDSVEELFELYNISHNQEPVQVSETFSQGPEETTRSSDDDVHSSLSTTGTRKLRPRSLNADAAGRVSTVNKSSANKEISPKKTSLKETSPKNTTAIRTRGSLNKNTANSRSVSDTGSRRKVQKKTQKPSKEEMTMHKAKKQEKKSDTEEGPKSPSAAVVTLEENKENMDAPPMEESSLNEVY